MAKKIPVVIQKDIKDCGACCLQSLVIYYGGYVSLEKIREDTFTNINGTTLYHLIQAARRYGFDAIGKKCALTELANIIMPAIVHVRFENGFTHFMILYKLTADKVYLMDPAKGKCVMSLEKFLLLFTGGVVELFPKNQITFWEKKSTVYDLFTKIILANKKLLLISLLSNFILVIVTIILSFYFKVGYEMSLKDSYINSFKYILYLFLIFTLIKIVISYLKNYYESHLDKNIDINLFREFISHIFHLPLKVIDTRCTGEIVTRVSELFNIKNLFTQLYLFCTLDLTMALVAMVLLFNLNSNLTFILLGIMFLYIILSLIFSPYLYKRIMSNIEYQTIFNSNLIENLDMMHSIKNLNNDNYALHKIETSICHFVADNYDLEQKVNGIETIKSIVFELGIYAINTYGLISIYTDQLSLVSFITFNSLMYYLINPIKNVVSLIPKFNFLRASYNKLCDFIDIDEEKLGNVEKFDNGSISFDNVTFSYDHFHNIFENISFTIASGEKVMLNGQSGSGKSTICELIKKNYDPINGVIKISGKNILDCSINTIRNNIVYVGQKEKLFSDTIKNNILFGDKITSQFERVCSLCEIDNIVINKPFRYEFGVDASFTNISGGEKQRIVLARALMKKSKILILDEALSELDYFLERKIIKNIIKAYPDKTIIYITHKKQEDLFERIINIKGGCSE